MKKLAIAAATLVTLSGAALAQEAPALIYSDAFAKNVQNVTVDGGASYAGRASATQDVGGSTSAPATFNINANPDYSGR